VWSVGTLSEDCIPNDDDGVGTAELEQYEEPKLHSVPSDASRPSPVKTCCNANRTASFRLFGMSLRSLLGNLEGICLPGRLREMSSTSEYLCKPGGHSGFKSV
jgi:hypothetical protein